MDNSEFLDVLDDQIRIRLAGLPAPADTPLGRRDVISIAVFAVAAFGCFALVVAAVFDGVTWTPAAVVLALLAAAITVMAVQRKLLSIRVGVYTRAHRLELEAITDELVHLWTPTTHDTITRLMVQFQVVSHVAQRL